MNILRTSFLSCMVVTIITTPSQTAPVAGIGLEEESANTAMEFMKRFGYLDAGDPNTEALYQEEAIIDAIKTVQKFGAIEQTGKLDNATLQLMKSQRCGVPDLIRLKRKRRYIIGSEGWKKRNITYFVSNWTPKIGEGNVRNEIHKAFNAWSGYARLHFQHIQDTSADIIVGFGRGPHGDYYPFDGPGNILAHAYFPYEHGSYGGDVHFDDDEEWTIRPKELDNGVDFFSVAVHELGHSLGLSHSPVPGSVMFPYYKGYQPNFQLDYDDILAMYDMYISRNNLDDVTTAVGHESSETAEENEESNSIDDDNIDCCNDYWKDSYTTPPTTSETVNENEGAESHDGSDGFSSTTPKYNVTFLGDDESVDEHLQHDTTHTNSGTNITVPDICLGNFDAISVLRNELFIFKESYMWRLSDHYEILPGYPVRLHQFFWTSHETIYTKVDAIYERNTDHSIILFTGDTFWVHDGDKFIENSPKYITEYGFPAYVKRIDAAFVWAKNGKTFLFSENMYWRYNETSRKMDDGYPRNISRWRGVPTHLDAAMTWLDGQTYFFKKNLFWRFNNQLIKIDNGYPLITSAYWLQCS